MTTLSIALVLTPLILQGLAMAVDELYFHRKRGLPQWERLGHPVDTLSVMIPLMLPVLLPFEPVNVIIYTSFALLSCLIVTKDEFVHAKLCEPAENWLHAILFVLHPLTFLSIGLIWFARDVVGSAGELETFIYAQPALTLFVFLYQITYWSILWPRIQTAR